MFVNRALSYGYGYDQEADRTNSALRENLLDSLFRRRKGLLETIDVVNRKIYKRINAQKSEYSQDYGHQLFRLPSLQTPRKSEQSPLGKEDTARDSKAQAATQLVAKKTRSLRRQPQLQRRGKRCQKQNQAVPPIIGD